MPYHSYTNTKKSIVFDVYQVGIKSMYRIWLVSSVSVGSLADSHRSLLSVRFRGQVNDQLIVLPIQYFRPACQLHKAEIKSVSKPKDAIISLKWMYIVPIIMIVAKVARTSGLIILFFINSLKTSASVVTEKK